MKSKPDQFPIPAEIPFQKVLDALLDTETPFPARYLYRLSDLPSVDQEALAGKWSAIPAWRRQALLEDAVALSEDDLVLSFYELGMLAVKDHEEIIRLLAVRILSDLEKADLSQLFLDLAVSDPKLEVQAAAVTALGQYVYWGELEELHDHVKDQIEEILLNIYRTSDSIKIRQRALESLGFSSREEVDGLILEAYQQGGKDWVASAVVAMGRSANERWTPQVADSLESPFPSVRAEAARSAGELDMRESVPILLEYLDDPDEDVAAAAVWSLSELGGEGVREALSALYDHAEDEEVLEYLESAMENLAFTEGVQSLELLELSDDDLDGEPDEDDEDIFDEIDELDDLDDD